MKNPTEEYDRLHDHCQALGRERDRLKLEVERLKPEVERLTDELYLAHEAMRRAFPENQQ
jgi:predicted RNase H-like nuclease (RuvC/YqgF family)